MTDKPSTLDLPVFRELFENEIGGVVRQRLHLTVALFLALVGTSVCLEFVYHPERARLAEVFYGLETLACLMALAGLRWTRLQRRPTTVSVALGATLAVLLTTYAASAGVPIERVATSHVCLLSGLLVLMPWGWRAQLAVSLAVVLSVVCTLPLSPASDAWSYSVLAVATGAITSVWGAYFLARYRYEAFVRTGLLTRESALRAGILDASLDAFIAMDRSGAIVEFNGAAERMFGRQRHEVVGGALADLLIPEDLRDQHRRGVEQYLATGRGPVVGQRFQTRGLRADGVEFPVEIAITSVVRDGEPLFAGYLRDLSDQKRAEEEQSAAYRLLETIRHVQRLFIEDSPGTKLFGELVTHMLASTQSEYGFLAEVVDPHGRWSPRALAVAQLEWTEPTHQAYRRCSAPDQAALDLRAMCAPVVTSGKPVAGVRAGFQESATGIDIRTFLGLPVYHAGAELVGVVGLVNRPGGYDDRVIEYLRPLLATGAAIIKAHRSNVERRQAEVALAASKERIEEEAEIVATLLHVAQMLDEYLGSPDMLERVNQLTVDVLGCDFSTIHIWDERAEVFRFKAAVGVTPEVLAEMAPATFARDSMPILATMEAGKPIEISTDVEQSLIPPSLLERWDSRAVLVVPITRKAQIVGIFTNGYRQPRRFSARQRRLAAGIAHTIALALENSRLIADLQTANRLKTEFVSTMSHELRTPLNVILGFTAMARDARVNPTDREHCLARIEASGRDLLALIEDTLEIAKIEEGRDRVDIVPVALANFWEALGEMCARLPRNPGVALEWMPPAGSGAVHTDARKLTVMVRNLVGNACKFTEHGWVRAEVAIDNDQLVVRIADSGIGIRREDQKIIFDMFRQADGSDSRRFGGTGLGLYIVRSYVQQLRGSIVVDSAPGQGAAFTITLPCAPQVAPAGDQHAVHAA